MVLESPASPAVWVGAIDASPPALAGLNHAVLRLKASMAAALRDERRAQDAGVDGFSGPAGEVPHRAEMAASFGRSLQDGEAAAEAEATRVEAAVTAGRPAREVLQGAQAAPIVRRKEAPSPVNYTKQAADHGPKEAAARAAQAARRARNPAEIKIELYPGELECFDPALVDWTPGNRRGPETTGLDPMKGKLGVIYVVERTTGRVLDTYMARGGPEVAYKGEEGVVAAPSQKDRRKDKDDRTTYRLGKARPHARWSAWANSRIPYGSKLREGSSGFEFSDDGQKTWHKVPRDLERRAGELLDQQGVWLDNDFGALELQVGSTAKFVHTSPDSEMIYRNHPEADPKGSAGPQAALSSSHACIHIFPRDRDQMIAAGYLQGGVDITIHDYATRSPWVADSQTKFAAYLDSMNKRGREVVSQPTGS